MKHFTIFISALLFSMLSFAAKTTAVVTAGANASYTSSENSLSVTGLSAEEVGYNSSLVLQVYGWDGKGSKATGYAAILLLEGEEVAFCDDGLMITKNQEAVLTITGKMLGYPYDYQFNAQVNPKQATTIAVVSDKMQVEQDPSEPKDLRLTANVEGYAIEISLFGGMTKQYGTYHHEQFLATINLTNVVLTDSVNGFATFSQEGDLAKFEASFIYNMDTLALSLTGFPYEDPENITPVDSVSSIITSAYIGKKSGLNTVSGQNEEIEVKIQLVDGNWGTGADEDDFSYGSYIKVNGTQLKILRGQLKVVQKGLVKTATIGVLCSDRVWYDITATTASELSTALENVATTVAPVKVIENGKLIIIRNGIKYNISGARL